MSTEIYEQCLQGKFPSMPSHDFTEEQPIVKEMNVQYQRGDYGGFRVRWTLSCCTLLFFSSLDRGPVQMASPRVLPHPTGGGVCLCARYSETLPWAVPIGSGTCWIVRVRTQNFCLIGSFPSFSLTSGSNPEGLLFNRGMI
jgi:hypothetical protein